MGPDPRLVRGARTGPKAGEGRLELRALYPSTAVVCLCRPRAEARWGSHQVLSAPVGKTFFWTAEALAGLLSPEKGSLRH